MGDSAYAVLAGICAERLAIGDGGAASRRPATRSVRRRPADAPPGPTVHAGAAMSARGPVDRCRALSAAGHVPSAHAEDVSS